MQAQLQWCLTVKFSVILMKNPSRPVEPANGRLRWSRTLKDTVKLNYSRDPEREMATKTTNSVF